jgi:glycosyltransferase involved in cell wall biosynthesis
MDLSIVIPAYNEEKNILPLHRRLKDVLDKLGKSYEIIFIDDGSTDRTFEGLQRIKGIKIIKFRKNFGQTAAFDAGFKEARGKIVIAMDADLQNDPSDIPRLLSKMEEGFDVVSGWRYDRKDTLSKRIFSKIANTMRRVLTGERLHDSGCSLKAYKKECLQDLDLYGEMHRFIPAFLTWRGFRIGEIKVKHHKRRYGKTKYNVIRVIKGFLDLLLIVFWQRYSARPIHLFGGIGLVMNFSGFLIGLYLLYIKLIFGQSIANRPILLLGILMIILGVQFIIFGILADIVMKVYHKDRKNYYIEKVIG